MVTWVTQEMLYNGDDDSAFALDCMVDDASNASESY